MDKARILNVLVGRFRYKAYATKENMLTALITEGDRPAMTAYPHKIPTVIIKTIVFPLGISSKGFSKNLHSNNTIPICNPETARI
jgi:hypothetical protein